LIYFLYYWLFSRRRGLVLVSIIEVPIVEIIKVKVYYLLLLGGRQVS
jgi:hypothetical protein